MFIAGIAMIRNEEAIIQDTLDHMAQWCGGIYLFDDASTDSTVEIAEAHPAVRGIHRNAEWSTNRGEANRHNRQVALEMAQADSPQWIFCFDADERYEFPPNTLDWDHWDAFRMKLFDYYITPEDAERPYTARKWLGPEYRAINMLYRNTDRIAFRHQGQREMQLPGYRINNAGYVKHYGKAISVEEWEKTCDYYATHWAGGMRAKWLARQGKAIHADMLSDWGHPLIQWHEKDTKGFLLTRKIELGVVKGLL
jgi:glycosyltransferase involved in cell wall biosynthesis